jgi:type I restriction enzyme S subunit
MNTKNNPKSFLDEIPKSWKYDRLKDVVTLRDCRTDERSEVEDYLELEDIESGTGRILSRRNTLEVESNVTCFKKGDVLFGKLRPYLEKYYFAEFDGKCTGEILAFAPEGIEGHFLRYCVAAPWFVAECNAMAYGAKMPRVNWPKQLAIFDIPLPPRDEQRRIAAYLDKGCAAIDGAIRAKRQQVEVLDNLRKSIIHKAVTRGLDERVDLVVSGNETIGLMPRLWKRTKFRYEIDVRSGDFVSDKLDDDGAYPVIGGNGLMGRAHDFNVDGEVVVVGRVGAYCGNVHYVKGRAWVSDNALIVESRHDKRFLTYLLRALDLNSFAKKTAQPLVTGTQIKNSHVALPPVDEQRQIVEYLESKSARIKDLESNLSAQITTLEQYRKSLIHECVTGKRRIE